MSESAFESKVHTDHRALSARQSYRFLIFPQSWGVWHSMGWSKQANVRAKPRMRPARGNARNKRRRRPEIVPPGVLGTQRHAKSRDFEIINVIRGILIPGIVVLFFFPPRKVGFCFGLPLLMMTNWKRRTSAGPFHWLVLTVSLSLWGHIYI